MSAADAGFILRLPSRAPSSAPALTYVLEAFDANGNPLLGAVDYGDIDVGQVGAGTQAGQIRNTGTGVVVLQAVNLTGDAAFSPLTTGGTANCGATASLAAGQSCNVYAAFAPSVPGTVTASYTLTATGGQVATIGLAGTGTEIVGCTAGKVAYSYSGADLDITVPAGCHTAIVKAWGAGGGRQGGGGGFAQGSVIGVTGTLVVAVGRGGESSGEGGGLTGVFQGSVSQGNARVIAGGGGGGGSNVTYRGGAGGGAAGSAGSGSGGGTGGGGTQLGGGLRAYSGIAAGTTSGTALTGGAAAGGGAAAHSGGGGAGYFGGGGGYLGGGGGGSGYAAAEVADISLTTGNGCSVAKSEDSDYLAGVGNCGAGGTGQNGRVVILWQ
jgi:hypothetical protein